VLLLAGLLSLQVSISGSRLVYELPAFALIALAALIACATLRVESKPDVVCLAVTAVFIAYIVGRALTSPSPYYARADLYAILAAATVYGLTANLLSRSSSRMLIVGVLLAFAIIHVLVCLIQFGIGHNFIVIPALEKVEATTRPSGLYGGPAYLAGLLEVLGIFGLSIACWSRSPKATRVIAGYLAVVCYVGVAFTGSRAGYLGVSASILAFGLLSLVTLRSGDRYLLWKWGSVGIVVLAFAIWAGSSFLTRSESLSQRVTAIADVDQGRLDLWKAAIRQWQLQPWTGTGSGTYRFYGREFRSDTMQADPVAAHSDYLHLLAEYGVFGAATFLTFLGIHLHRGWRNFVALGPARAARGGVPLSDRLALNVGALSSVVALAVHSAVDFNMHIPANALLLAFVFGLLANRGVSPDAGEMGAKASRIPKLATAAVSLVLLVQSVRLLPGEYYADRSRIALENENPASAVALANKALQFEQRNPKIYFYLGRALSAIGNDRIRPENRPAYYEAALSAFDRARLLNPLDATHAWDMAILYDRLQRFDEAEWMYSLARERDPRSLALREQYRSHLRLWEKSR
jgi:hypothetical protein